MTYLCSENTNLFCSLRTFARVATLSVMFLPPLSICYYSKRKGFILMGKFFPFWSRKHFQSGLGYRQGNRVNKHLTMKKKKSRNETKRKLAENPPSVSIPLNYHALSRCLPSHSNLFLDAA